MVYLLRSDKNRFWRCQKTGAKTVVLSFGKVGFPGRTMKKTNFKSKKEAAKYVSYRTKVRHRSGYNKASDPKTSKQSRKGNIRTKNKRPCKTARENSTPMRRNTASKPTSQYLCGKAIVDRAVLEENSQLASRAKVHETLHARLALVDPSKNKDGYHILQVLVDESDPNGTDYYLFSRWGHTGSEGQRKLEGPLQGGENEALSMFSEIFETKTGVAWNKAVRGAPPEAEKFEFLRTMPRDEKKGSWFYYLVRDPLGKPDGWYEYDEDNAVEVEELHGQYEASDRAARLSTRFVHSSSSGFTYKVVLSRMIQENTKTGKTRPIQRTTTGLPPQYPPSKQL